MRKVGREKKKGLGPTRARKAFDLVDRSREGRVVRASTFQVVGPTFGKVRKDK